MSVYACGRTVLRACSNHSLEIERETLQSVHLFSDELYYMMYRRHYDDDLCRALRFMVNGIVVMIMLAQRVRRQRSFHLFLTALSLFEISAI